jgi:predicted component of type VI protein secretion system
LTLLAAGGCSTLSVVPGRGNALTLNRLREERSADLAVRNLMDALLLVYELRARYRVFAFEATQEGAEDCAKLFAALSEVEGEQVKALMQGLRERLAMDEHAEGEPPR